MKPIFRLLWALAGAALVAALIAFAWNSITRGTDDTAIATLIFAVIAAVSATVGTVATLLGNQEASNQQRQIASDISRLAELTESSIEGNVSSPRYRDGSVIVEFEIDKLLHGIPESTENPGISKSLGKSTQRISKSQSVAS